LAEAAGIDPRALLLESFRAAVAAADPLLIVPSHLPPPPRGRTLVIGAGKAAASMAAAVERPMPGSVASASVDSGNRERCTSTTTFAALCRLRARE